MRYVYSENEPIEKAPPRQDRDYLVIINKKTGFPEVAQTIVSEGIWFVYLVRDGVMYVLSPYDWEIAWP